jgi:hypothetical protein
MTDRFGDAERGQSITLNYTMGLGIGVVLITGLLIAGGNFVSDQQKSAARTELNVIGQQVAADVSTADRLAQSTGNNSTVTLRRSLPNRIAGSVYQIELVEGPNAHLRLESTDPDISVRIEIANETDVVGSRVNGGTIRLNQSADGDLVLESGGSP